MAIKLEKLSNGSVKITNGSTITYLNNLQNVEITSMSPSSNDNGSAVIVVTYTDGEQVIAASEISTINGQAKPGTIAAIVDLLATEVFKFGGGVGDGDTTVPAPTPVYETRDEIITKLNQSGPQINSGVLKDAVVNYYINPAGSDTADGLTPSTAWKTLGKIGSTAFTKPSKINLLAGAVFTGNIYLTANSTAPVMITTYGGGKWAEIKMIDGSDGIMIYNKSQVIIEKVIIDGMGLGLLTGKAGLAIYSDLALCYDYVIRHCIFKNSAYFGTAIGAGGNSGNKIKGVYIHDCVYTGNANGLSTYGVNDTEYSVEDVLIERVFAYDNLGNTGNTWSHTGSGIIVGGVKNGLVQYCEAYNNGLNNGGTAGGPFGIWTYNSDGVTIQLCKSHDNKTGSGMEDGGGFDIDGGAQNCTVQYCESYNNYGPGMMLCEFGSTNPFQNNVFQFNTSRNDGRAGGKGAIGICQKVTNSYIRNNKIYFDLQGTVGATTAQIFRIYNPIMTGIVVRDNDFFLGDNVQINSLGTTDAQILLRNNIITRLSNTPYITRANV